MTETTTPVGRLVQGHPMVAKPVMDKRTGQQKLNKRQEPMEECFFAIAIPKGQETQWSQTAWGQPIFAAGQQGWPAGEFNAPTFAWKVTDGDSQTPDQRGRNPCTKEGFPGHWVLSCKNGFPVPCYHVGRYSALDCLKVQNEIKCGDYIRVQFTAVGNAPSESPGVYINPIQVELTRAGVIIRSGPDAESAFGSVAPVMPQNAMVDEGIPAQQHAQAQQGAPGPGQQHAQAQQVTPAPTPAATVQTLVATGQHTLEALRAAGWADDAMVQAGHARWDETPVSTGVVPQPNFV